MMKRISNKIDALIDYFAQWSMYNWFLPVIHWSPVGSGASKMVISSVLLFYYFRLK